MNDKFAYLFWLTMIYVPTTYLATQNSFKEGCMVGISGMTMISIIGWFARRYE